MTPRVSGHTKVAAVLGHPVRHSLSPVIHNAGFESLGVDWTYVALPTPIEQLTSVLDLCRAEVIAGASVTMPLKTAAYEAMDDVSPAARVLRSVNTVSAIDGRLVGHSTDGDGLVDSLLEEGCTIRGSSALVLGWGGAARSVVDAIHRAGVERIVVTNRSGVDPLDLSVIEPSGRSVPWTERDSTASEVDFVINCTSVGMGDDDSSPLDTSVLRPSTTVVDLVYHPIETTLLKTARARGCPTVGGLGMLIHQAVRQQQIWLGQRPDPSVMKDAALQALAERR